ncbi:MAG: hypothetical protein LUE87_05495 [Lachnospiraceae bacterium]|nr:hypothetical protein [Lachnospiraceae bacterium]
MKRFSKALSLLVAAAVLMTCVSTSVSATTVSSVEQDESTVELLSVEGVAEGTEVIVSMPEDITSDLAHTGVADEHDEEMAEAIAVATAAPNATQAVDGGLAAEAAALGVNENDLQITSLFNVYVQDHVDGDPVTLTVKTQHDPGTPYIVLHFFDGKWNVNSYGTVGANGTVTFTADRFSPFAIVTVSDTSYGKTSPQTGENVNALLVAAIALAAVASVVAVSGRRVTR